MEREKLTRCFVALDLSRQVINEIRRIQFQLKKQIKFNCKYTEPENLHLTLKFLGEINDKAIDDVKKKLKEIEFSNFDVSLGEVGAFQSRQSYVIWVELNNKFIRKLQKLVDNKLKDLFKSEHRFMGHITIVRSKKMKLPSKELKSYLSTIKPKKIKFNINKFFLKKSELFETGPVYSDLESYGLL